MSETIQITLNTGNGTLLLSIPTSFTFAQLLADLITALRLPTTASGQLLQYGLARAIDRAPILPHIRVSQSEIQQNDTLLLQTVEAPVVRPLFPDMVYVAEATVAPLWSEVMQLRAAGANELALLRMLHDWHSTHAPERQGYEGYISFLFGAVLAAHRQCTHHAALKNVLNDEVTRSFLRTYPDCETILYNTLCHDSYALGQRFKYDDARNFARWALLLDEEGALARQLEFLADQYMLMLEAQTYDELHTRAQTIAAQDPEYGNIAADVALIQRHIREQVATEELPPTDPLTRRIVRSSAVAPLSPTARASRYLWVVAAACFLLLCLFILILFLN